MVVQRFRLWDGLPGGRYPERDTRARYGPCAMATASWWTIGQVMATKCNPVTGSGNRP